MEFLVYYVHQKISSKLARLLGSSEFLLAYVGSWIYFDIHTTLNSEGVYKHAFKVITHKLCGEQFLWNRNWDLGWVWASWQYWKTNWADYEQLLRSVFSCFQGQKKIRFFFLNIAASALKKLHKMKLKKKLKISWKFDNEF